MFKDLRLKARIDNFTEDNFAILDVGGLKIEWPRLKLPDGLGIGDTLILEALNETQAKKKNKLLAQEILNEILEVQESD